jgi:hypothetical protein
MEGTILRGLIIVRGQCHMPIVRGTAATGDIVRPTIVRRCRRIGRGTAVPGRVSRAIRVIGRAVPEDRRAVLTMGVQEPSQEGRVLGLRDIARELRETEIARGLLGMGIAREQVLEVLEMEIDQGVGRVEVGRPSRDRVESRHHSLALRSRTVLRPKLGPRSPVRRRRPGQRNLVPRSRRGLHRAVLVRNLVLRNRADLHNSLGRQGNRHRDHGLRQTGGQAASRISLCCSLMLFRRRDLRTSGVPLKRAGPARWLA